MNLKALPFAPFYSLARNFVEEGFLFIVERLFILSLQQVHTVTGNFF
jgi:hypothetical protein